VYTYYCRIHPQNPSMTGQIFVVGPPAQPELIITRLSPNTAPAGSPTLQLAIDGLAIADGAKVRFNGVELTPRILSPPDQVIVDVPANLLAVPGEVNVTVVNSNPNAVSNALPFTIVGGQELLYLPLVAH
jgi:hypothetical protein